MPGFAKGSKGTVNLLLPLSQIELFGMQPGEATPEVDEIGWFDGKESSTDRFPLSGLDAFIKVEAINKELIPGAAM